MTRQRLLVQVRPVEVVTEDKYICPRCGIAKGLPTGRIKPDMCGDCKSVVQPSDESIAFGMLTDRYTPDEVAASLGIKRHRVGRIRERAMQ